MSILGSLLGLDDNKLEEKDIAMDMLKDSKFTVTALSAAAAEAVNPELRNMLRSKLDTAVKEHFELSDLAIRKGWYPAFESPEGQLKQEKEKSQNLS
jgi:similar to spore coat protein